MTALEPKAHFLSGRVCVWCGNLIDSGQGDLSAVLSSQPEVCLTFPVAGATQLT